MRITAFIGAALLGLCMLAFAPVAMAGPAPDICVLDLSQPVTIDLAIDTAGMTCSVLGVEVASAVPIMPSDERGPAGLCMTKTHATAFDFADHRQHEDPGRCMG
jgi:hypothetical protein